MALPPPVDKTQLVVARHWHKPEIVAAIRYTKEGGHISLEMSAEDFARAIVHELGRQRWALKQAVFEDRVVAAHLAVIEKLKTHSTTAIAL